MATAIYLEALHTAFTIARPSPQAVVVTITGCDIGELGAAPFRELERQLEAGFLPEIFIDARATRGASVEVSAAWAVWLMRHKQRYRALHMLTGSRLVEVTAAFVRRFTGLGDQMRIYTDAAAFHAACPMSRVTRTTVRSSRS
jgi:hypothetical protein